MFELEKHRGLESVGRMWLVDGVVEGFMTVRVVWERY